jgi:hypothetical protein
MMREEMEISCINPSLYEKRFISFIRKEFLNRHRSNSTKLFSEVNLFDHKNYMHFSASIPSKNR